jgi:hypothetical protein
LDADRRALEAQLGRASQSSEAQQLNFQGSIDDLNAAMTVLKESLKLSQNENTELLRFNSTSKKQVEDLLREVERVRQSSMDTLEQERLKVS